MAPRPVATCATRVGATFILVIGLIGLVGCTPAARPGSLLPTLVIEEHDGFAVATQNGIPVPTFERQNRRRIELDGPWRVERVQLAADLSLTDRAASLESIEREAEGREDPSYDDSKWPFIDVPGALNTPPDGHEIGGWYRRSFYVPPSWAGRAAILKFGSANYVADVWVNEAHLGYHEGGYTPFAFDVGAHLRPGERNQVAVRVDNPAWGTRNDIVPWGLADWWNYGGLTGPVWIEALPPTHLVRADVVPHLDGLDLSLLVRRSADGTLTGGTSPTASGLASASTAPMAPSGTGHPSDEPGGARVRIEVFAADVRPDNLTDPLAAALVPEQAAPEVSDELPIDELDPGQVLRLDTAFLLGGVDAWSPARPALYVLHVVLEDADGSQDELWETFGLRRVSVDTATAQLLLNGQPIMFNGVGLHDERIASSHSGSPDRAPAARVTIAEDLLAQLEHAGQVNADLIRAGHAPANPLLLMLADRLGFAVWEELPLYHYTPLTYGIAMQRGIPQQMLREMALRDMNHPSVLFHGLSNESTGIAEREDALGALHEIDRQIDGTRLTGQAAYASTADDPTHGPLDVAGFTFYYGVFYGPDAATGTARALQVAHGTHPDKPVLALEFGRWADGPSGPEEQRRVLEETFPQFAQRSAGRGGYVGAATWWTLEDFTTMMPGIAVEQFGMYRPSGGARPVAGAAARLFEGASGQGDVQDIEPDVARAEVIRDATTPDLRLVGYLAYGLGFGIATLAGVLVVVVRRGGRAAPGAPGQLLR